MSLEELASLLPAGRVSTDPADRAAHARDWWSLAMLRERRGDELALPVAVVRPASTADVAVTLAWADRWGTPVVAFGGGSGVCGAAQAGESSIALDTRALDAIVVDDTRLTVACGAGVMGPVLEAALNEHGLTLGHFPQSIDISTVGGWCATRSAGQKSSVYGRIDDMVLGMEVVLAGGRVARIPARFGSSAGPDLTRIFLGSEGTMGVITEVTLAVHEMPRGAAHAAAGFDRFGDGLEAMRLLARAGCAPAVCRLYDEADAAIALRERAPGGSVLLLRFEGEGPRFEASREAALAIVAQAGGRALDGSLAQGWWERRNAAVHTYATIMLEGALGPTGAVDTMEIAAFWPADAAYERVREALSAHADVVGCHASHVYPQGACLYFTFAFLNSPDDAIVEERYREAWSSGLQAAVEVGATITHHHGVGMLRAPWMSQELGESIEILRAVKAALDPRAIMNPGKAGL